MGHYEVSVQFLAQTGVLSLAIAAAAAHAQVPAARAPLPTATIAGEYELIRIGDQPLPAVVFRIRITRAHLQLRPDGGYTGTESRDICAPDGRCVARAGSARGTWRVTPDGEIELRREPKDTTEDVRTEVWEADGRQLRFYTVEGSARVLGEVYERVLPSNAGERGPAAVHPPPNEALQLAGMHGCSWPAFQRPRLAAMVSP